MTHAISMSLAWILAVPLSAQNCNRTSTGLVPLTDLGSARYKTFDGGLYGSGSNVIPAGHLAAGQRAAASIRPLDRNGNASANGNVVVISIGMSNTTQEFSTFVRMSDADPNRAAAVRVVDCAQGGQDATKVADPNAQYWTVANQRIQRAGLTPAQVQVAWIKQAIARPTNGFPGAAKDLQGFLVKIAQNLKSKFPNLRIVYVSNRIYAGYATTTLNPEPYAYESGFAVKWLLEQQIAGSADLNFDPNKGTVRSAWLAWGPYLWADGLKGRKIDSLQWQCADFRADGTHPSPAGMQKVAELLDRHFKTHVTAKPWYVGSSGNRAAVVPYGTGCVGGRGALRERWNSLPVLGSQIAVGIANARAQAPVAAFLSGGRASLRLDAQCTLLLDLAKLLTTFVLTSSTNGTAIVRLQIPNDRNLSGAKLFQQFLVVDAAAPGLRVVGGAALSRGIELRLGGS